MDARGQMVYIIKCPVRRIAIIDAPVLALTISKQTKHTSCVLLLYVVIIQEAEVVLWKHTALPALSLFNVLEVVLGTGMGVCVLGFSYLVVALDGKIDTRQE
jgi:hypothetical protein